MFTLYTYGESPRPDWGLTRVQYLLEEPRVPVQPHFCPPDNTRATGGVDGFLHGIEQCF